MSNTQNTDDDPIYDLVIVGRGMIGSAAARHAAKLANRNEFRIALVGPSEGHEEVFGAHHDEGRITRKTDTNPIWAELAARSIDRYKEIQQDAGGGMDFYVECGHLAVSTQGSETIQSRVRNASHMSVKMMGRLDSTSALSERFPFLNFPEHCEGILETMDAGYISARGLVAAQTKAAIRFGVEVYDAVVEEVIKEENNGGLFVVRCSNNKILHSKKVLVAAGAFTNARPLLPEKLDLTPMRTQTVHFLLTQDDATRLQDMPSIIFKDNRCWAYLLPPIRYPDGSIRLKLGGASIHEQAECRNMQSNQQVLDWYLGSGDEATKQEMTEMLHAFVPNTKPLQILTDTCATLYTPTGQAYIGEVAPGWVVATGGNGAAAKSSDELGRLAALCILNGEAFCQEEICGEPVRGVLQPRTIASRDVV
jgi:glycine/D-amino acid oxidase-like deaminating enzyme